MAAHSKGRYVAAEHCNLPWLDHGGSEQMALILVVLLVPLARTGLLNNKWTALTDFSNKQWPTFEVHPHKPNNSNNFSWSPYFCCSIEADAFRPLLIRPFVKTTLHQAYFSIYGRKQTHVLYKKKNSSPLDNSTVRRSPILKKKKRRNRSIPDGNSFSLPRNRLCNWVKTSDAC